MSARFHVAPTGDGAGDGSREKPFATLAAARDAIRRLRRRGGLPKGGVTVHVAPGVHVLDETFELGSDDSGEAGAPIMYCAAANGAARLLGGRILRDFVPANDPAVLGRLDPVARPHVMQCDLGAAGVGDLGLLRSRGFSREVAPAHLELFFGDEPMTLARWPNAGEWARIAAVPDESSQADGHGRKYGQLAAGFFFDTDRPARWQDTSDLWVHGYWAWEWANSYEKVAELDASRRFLRTASPHGLYGFRTGQRFFFLNVLEELDQPGEYYVDRRTGMLYFWPPAPVGSAEAMVSVLEGPMVRLRDAQHVTLRGLTLECTRGTGIHVAGGDNCRIDGCVIRHTGNHAVRVDGGLDHAVVDSDLYDNGDGGVVMNGGDRRTLTPACHRVHNCHFHHQGRWSRCYVPAIGMTGVGLVAANNLIHDHPHIAILFTGNDHAIERNEIHHVCQETGDTGAIYTGRDWTFQGNVIRHNYIHDVREPGWGGSFSIYLDDCVSGITVEGNIVADSNTGVLLGGGRDCILRNNIFYHCQIGVRIDARGMAVTSPVWRNMVYKTMKERLEAMNHRQPPYSTRFPSLAKIDDYLAGDKGVPPEGDVVAHNICVGGQWLMIRWNAEPGMIDLQDNIIDAEGDVGFVDPANPAAAGFSLRPDSRALAAGFEPISFDRIGLQRPGSA